MVKAAELGRPSRNLEKYPNTEEKKKQGLERAIRNLTSSSLPQTLITKKDFPKLLHSFLEE